MSSEGQKFVGVATVIVVGIAIAVALLMWIVPNYGVYSQRLAGEAKLAESESSRKVLIEEAKAKKESAKLLAEAEIERAKGVAEANKIIGESLKDNESYLRYLWITNLDTGNRETIYVPTEAGLPILEASRFMLREKQESKKPEK